MKKKLINSFALTALITLPLGVAAYNIIPEGGKTSISAAGIMQAILNIIWPMFIGYAIIMFIVAGYKFLANKPEEGRKGLLLGVIGVIVGIFAWGLPRIIYNWLS